MGQRKIVFDRLRRKSRTRYNIGNHSQTSKIHKNIGNILSQIWWIQTNKLFKKSFQKQENKSKKNAKKHLIYVMIPGNPGISSAYVHWMKTLVSMFNHYKTHFDYSRKLKRTESTSMIDHMPSNICKLLLDYDSVTAFCISHANHACDIKNKNGNKLYDLNEQINHKIAFIEYLRNKKNNCSELRSLYENDPNGENMHFVLAGHSVGSYICLNILKHYEKHDASFAQHNIHQVLSSC